MVMAALCSLSAGSYSGRTGHADRFGSLLCHRLYRQEYRSPSDPDVYKRQPFNLPDFIKGSYNVGGVSIPKVYAVIVVVSMLLLVSIHPVSYTHLDVYKRQVKR